MADLYRRTLIYLGWARDPQKMVDTALKHHRSAVYLLDNPRYLNRFNASLHAHILQAHLNERESDTEQHRKIRTNRIIRHLNTLSKTNPQKAIDILEALNRAEFNNKPQFFNTIFHLKGFEQRLFRFANQQKNIRAAEKLVHIQSYQTHFPANRFHLIATIIRSGCHNHYITEENVVGIQQNTQDYQYLTQRLEQAFSNQEAKIAYRSALFNADPEYRPLLNPRPVTSNGRAPARPANRPPSRNPGLVVAHGGVPSGRPLPQTPKDNKTTTPAAAPPPPPVMPNFPPPSPRAAPRTPRHEGENSARSDSPSLGSQILSRVASRPRDITSSEIERRVEESKNMRRQETDPLALALKQRRNVIAGSSANANADDEEDRLWASTSSLPGPGN